MIECSRCNKEIKLIEYLDCIYTVSFDIHFSADSINNPEETTPICTFNLCEDCYDEYSKRFDDFMNEFAERNNHHDI